jgi:hypothetical protein
MEEKSALINNYWKYIVAKNIVSTFREVTNETLPPIYLVPPWLILIGVCIASRAIYLIVK